MRATVVKLLKWGTVIIGVSLISVLSVRAWEARRAPPLQALAHARPA